MFECTQEILTKPVHNVSGITAVSVTGRPALEGISVVEIIKHRKSVYPAEAKRKSRCYYGDHNDKGSITLE